MMTERGKGKVKRKMLKEEKELRDKLALSYETGNSIMVEKYVSREITALIRAVREDERKYQHKIVEQGLTLRDVLSAASGKGVTHP